MSKALAEKLEIWGFHSGFTVFVDGSLGFGLELVGLDISCWDEGAVDGFAERLKSLVNGLPSGTDLQFVVSIAKSGGALTAKHQGLGISKESELNSLTEARVSRFNDLDAAGLLPKHSFYLFVRRPFSGAAKIKSTLFSNAEKYPELSDRALAREVQASEQYKEELVRQFMGLGISAKVLPEKDLAQIIYKEWNPNRGVDLHGCDPDDIRYSLLFTDASISEKGFSLASTQHRVVSLKLLPDQTFSAMAACLGSLPFDSTLYVSIHVPDQQKELEFLQAQRRITFSMARGKTAGVSDIESEAKLQDLEDLVGQMVAQGEKVFHVSLNIILKGADENELEDRVTQTLTKLRELGGAEGMAETLAAFDIYTELSIPHSRSKERAKRMKTSNLIDFLPLYGPWHGHENPRILLRSLQGDLLGFDPFAKELPNYNQMVTGGSGSGKSFLTNLCLLQMLKEDPKIFIVDIGGSYKKLCDNLSGQYISFHLNSNLCLNPFDLGAGETTPSSQKIKFLVGLVEMMTKEEAAAHIGKLERAEIEVAIQKVYERSEAPRISDLKEILLGHSDIAIRRFGRIMAPWCGDTPFGRIIDRPTNIELARNLVCFDLKGLEVYQDLQAAVLYLITDYVWREIQQDRGRMKFLVLDECWKLLESGAGASFIGEVFRTFRKYFASAIAISQNVDDFAKSKVASAILPNTAIKWVLSQRGADFNRLKEVLQLNDNEIEQISRLHQERGVYSQTFLMAGEQHAVVAIEPTPLEYWIATTDPRDLGKMEAAEKEQPQNSPFEILKALSKKYPRGVVAGGES